MVGSLKPPIILIGNCRSGTTITQNLIGLHADIVTWFEPRTLWMYADPTRQHDEFTDIDATYRTIKYIRNRFLKYQLSNGGRQIMENTPSNVFRVPYVTEIFPECIYLFITRNPFSCISSMELKWQKTKTWSGLRRSLAVTPIAHLPYYGKDYVKQIIFKKILRRKYSPIYGPRYNGINKDLRSVDKLRVIARQWALGNRRAREDLAALGEGRVFSLRYEDLMQDTEHVLRGIYDHCGLTCSDDIIRRAKEMVDPGRQQKWLRLDKKDLKAILSEVEEEMRHYGYEIPAPLR